VVKTTFKLSEEYFKDMVERYNMQDTIKRRSITNNITEKDYAHFKEILEKEVCFMCCEGFTPANKPTLDRINNNIGHTLTNVHPCCL
jgi:hypothetical protein